MSIGKLLNNRLRRGTYIIFSGGARDSECLIGNDFFVSVQSRR